MGRAEVEEAEGEGGLKQCDKEIIMERLSLVRLRLQL